MLVAVQPVADSVPCLRSVGLHCSVCRLLSSVDSSLLPLLIKSPSELALAAVFPCGCELQVLPALRAYSDEYLLKELYKRWSNHKIMVRWLSRFFNYLDRQARLCGALSLPLVNSLNLPTGTVLHYLHCTQSCIATCIEAAIEGS